MNLKMLLVWVLAVIIIAFGGWLVYKNIAPGTAQINGTPEVQAQDITVGTGTQALPGSMVSVLYVGKLADGTIFDSSELHGNQPLTFELGAPGLIAGFQIGINGMKEGGERLMAIPPELAYAGNAVRQNPQDPNSPIVIPANSTIIFDVKLLKVSQASSTPASADQKTQ